MQKYEDFSRYTQEKQKIFNNIWLFGKKSVPLQPLFASCDGGLSKVNLILE
jgi:hypothetical protein